MTTDNTNTNTATDKSQNLNGIAQVIADFDKDPAVQGLKDLYSEKSLLEIVKLNRDENAHSDFIAWILNPSESHRLHDFPLKKFLGIIIKSNLLKNDSLKPEIATIIKSGTYTVSNTVVKREKGIKEEGFLEEEEKNGRIDILVETTIVENTNNGIEAKYEIRLVVENKIYSPESNRQTEKYFDYYTGKDERQNIFVYLTPSPSRNLAKMEEPECVCKKFIQINYQSIVDAILDPALRQDIGEHIKYRLKDYIHSLSQPVLTDNEEDKIMAIGKEEQELLLQFWESKNNIRLIAVIFEALAKKPELDKDKQTEAGQIAEQLKSLYEKVVLQDHTTNPFDNIEELKIGKEEQGLLLQSWEKNKGLIVSIYRALAKNPKLKDIYQEEAEKIANLLKDFNSDVGFQDHTINPSVQRFIRKVFNYFAERRLSDEPTQDDNGKRVSEVKKEYKNEVNFFRIELTKDKGQGINFWWTKEKSCGYGYISGDYKGIIPNDATSIQRRFFKEKCSDRKNWTEKYWNDHFVDFIEALKSGLNAEYEKWRPNLPRESTTVLDEASAPPITTPQTLAASETPCLSPSQDIHKGE
jgi:hypothetical protein